MTHDATLDRLKEKFGDGFTTSQFRDNFRLIVSADRVFTLLTILKQECGFDLLADVTAVDYLHYPNATDRYGVVYCLTNTATGERLVVKTHVNDPEPVVPSCFRLWKGADWMEREVYDMFGIVFDGHPDLRRILMPEEFTAFPLRKDYPLRGRAERHNFPAITRAES
ncbi:MAG: NADH-quinone oxidoreductase subunit C [Gemmataceae bacterium]